MALGKTHEFVYDINLFFVHKQIARRPQFKFRQERQMSGKDGKKTFKKAFIFDKKKYSQIILQKPLYNSKKSCII